MNLNLNHKTNKQQALGCTDVRADLGLFRSGILHETEHKGLIIWASASKKVLSSRRKMCGFTAYTRSNTGLCSQLIHSILSNDSGSG